MISNENFKKLAMPEHSPAITEYSLQMENGILDMLRDQPNYSEDFYPDDNLKQNVPLNVYSRNVYNWKLSC